VLEAKVELIAERVARLEAEAETNRTKVQAWLSEPSL
jgi:hypothetical protein